MHARQRGIALLILLAIISMAIIFALVAGLNKNAGELARARDQKTYAALAQAKAALIAYAVTYVDDPSHAYPIPGYLPCPDLGPGSNLEGAAAPNCGSFLVSAMGKLPWKKLGLDVLKDSSGECLWYAVSGTYKNNPNGITTNNTTSTSSPNNMMNWDTNGQFKVVDSNGNTLAGSSADNQAVAVIFAPGSTLSGQDRTTPSAWLSPSNQVPACGGNYTASAYLDTANGINNSTLVTPTSPGSVTDVSSFIAGTASDTFNDKLVYITRADIWNAIKKRSDFNNYLRAMTRLTAECIAWYGYQNAGGYPNDMRLPWASVVNLSSPSLPLSATAYYAVDRRYRDSSGNLSGRLPYRVSNSVNTLPNNNLSSNSDLGTSGYYLFSALGCGFSLPPMYTNNQKIWYDNWKDQLFYAVANNYQPSANNSPMDPCPACLTINGSGNYAAVVIFAGDKLTNAAGQITQPRNTATDKSAIANYLEGSNLASITANTGGGNYQAAVTASGTFNDIVYAIDTNLTVKCLSASSGAMVTVPTFGSPWKLADYAACP